MYYLMIFKIVNKIKFYTYTMYFLNIKSANNNHSKFDKFFE